MRSYKLPEPVTLTPGTTYVMGLEDGTPFVREATEEDRRSAYPVCGGFGYQRQHVDARAFNATADMTATKVWIAD
jgi:hypothetical protein